MTNERQDEAVLERRLLGQSPRTISRELHISLSEVNEALDRVLAEVTTKFRVTSLNLELERLDRVMKPFFEKALAGDVMAGQLLVKISERRCALLGLDSPVRIDPVQLSIDAKPRPSSYDLITEAIMQLRGDNGQQPGAVDTLSNSNDAESKS